MINETPIDKTLYEQLVDLYEQYRDKGEFSVNVVRADYHAFYCNTFVTKSFTITIKCNGELLMDFTVLEGDPGMVDVCKFIEHMTMPGWARLLF